MKIAFIIYSLNKGGAERVVSLLSSELSKQHEIKIILFSKIVSYKYGGDIIDLNLPSKSNKIGKVFNVLKRTYRLKEIFKEEKFDKIFAFMETAYLPSILTGYPIVSSVRNNPKVYNDFIINTILSKSEKIVAVSKTIENILNRQYNISNTTTILNPIIIDNNYKIKEDLQQYQPYILSVGRLNKQKNFTMLINSFAKSNVKEEANLLIVGEGNQRDELQNIIDKLALKDKVVLLGQKDNINDYYLQCDIYILSSSFEGFPNVLVEAFSNKCACIATNCPTGPSEIIQDVNNGILVDNENQEEMTKAIDKLYFSEELKVQFKKNTQKSIEHLSVEKIAKEWLRL